MKHFFTLILIAIIPNISLAQCSDLFISEYVEGSGNNKALEIYNPTPNNIDLSAYQVARYTNGSTQASTAQQLSGTIDPYSTFVIGLDKRDPNGTGYDYPMWDGYFTFIDTICAETFGQEITIYNPENNLQSLINLWSNGVYYSGTDPDSAAMYPQTMFYNGNDAIVLSAIGVGLVDVFGKVGEDPGVAWTDSDGNYWTKDHTLVRKPSIQNGFASNPISFDPTIEWDSLEVNTFVNLGSHNCICDPNYNGPSTNIYGCTNVNADNYNANANLDDGSCDYGDPCNSSVGLSEKINTFSIYPNPSVGSTFKLTNDLEIQDITVVNSIGEIILFKNGNKSNKIKIDIQSQKGVYFISLKDENGVKTKSVIID